MVSYTGHLTVFVMVALQGEGEGGKNRETGMVRCTVALDHEGVGVAAQIDEVVVVVLCNTAHEGGRDTDHHVVVVALFGTDTGFEGGWVGGKRGHHQLDWCYY